jgi:single-strand DNA-binding protein
MLKLQLIGNLGQDAEVKSIESGQLITFSVAATTSKKDTSVWVSCVKFVKHGESTAVAQYLKKGGKVYVEGMPEINIYTNKDGESKATLKCLVNQIELLGIGERSQSVTEDKPANYMVKHPSEQEFMPNDDLPF